MWDRWPAAAPTPLPLHRMDAPCGLLEVETTVCIQLKIEKGRSVFFLSLSIFSEKKNVLTFWHDSPPAGKLGHGDTNRVYRPKIIESLHGFIIRKVCAGSQSSLALTSAGQVRLKNME